jgi:hypothetical protein
LDPFDEDRGYTLQAAIEAHVGGRLHQSAESLMDRLLANSEMHEHGIVNAVVAEHQRWTGVADRADTWTPRNGQQPPW